MRQQLQALARYNRWMNEKLYAACARLDDAERKRDAGAFFGSIHATLNHVLLGDRVWLTRFTRDRERYASRDSNGEVIPITSLAQELYADFAELTRQRERTDADLRDWVEALDADSLQATLSYKVSGGSHKEHPLWWAALHVFNHQTHHRGQVTTLLSQQGIDVGVTDLAIMLRDGLD